MQVNTEIFTLQFLRENSLALTQVSVDPLESCKLTPSLHHLPLWGDPSGQPISDISCF